LTGSLKSNKYDVIIVGAGPAGATLAYQLARKGIRVLLVEKQKLPRAKCCAGGITAKAARLFDFDISPVVEDAVYEITFTFNFDNPYVGRCERPLLYTVKRDAFDYFLTGKAVEQGVVLLEACEPRQIQLSDTDVRVDTGCDVFSSQLIVGADGAYSRVARELGQKQGVEYIAAMLAQVVMPLGALELWRSRAQVDLGCTPGGYAWIFPKRNHLCVGVGSPMEEKRKLADYLHKLLGFAGLGGYPSEGTCAHLIPTWKKGREVVKGRVLLLGDAAGFADPLTGEGIYYAVRSAQLAASVIEDFLQGHTVGLGKYQGLVETELIPDLAVAGKVAKVLSRFPQQAFTLLHQSKEVWKLICGLMYGELSYVIIEEALGGWENIVGKLSGKQ